ncbi:MAG: C45 family peptidase [Syntrophorhabdaceae bacterium]|nr:C45 family peptidase [Syntrophorhabdaceae bacterium]
MKKDKGRPFLKVLIFILILISYLYPATVHGCTVWAATGEKADIKGAIIGKNRDNSPHLVTQMRFLYPVEGHKVFGLFDIEADGYIIGGINDCGLAVFNASAMGVPKIKRHVAKEDLTERILKTFSSVDAVLEDRDIFINSHPALYMLADPYIIAMIEVAPGGKVAVKKTESGVLAFTNHYIDPDLSGENKNNTSSSKERLRRINYLLEKKRSFSMDDFIAISGDRGAGPSFSIWRKGNSPEKIRTLGSLIIAIPITGLPEVYIKIASPKEEGIILRGKLDFSRMIIEP